MTDEIDFNLELSPKAFPKNFDEWAEYRYELRDQSNKFRKIDEIMAWTLDSIRNLEESRGDTYVFVTPRETREFCESIDEIAKAFLKELRDHAGSIRTELVYDLVKVFGLIIPSRTTIYVQAAIYAEVGASQRRLLHL